MIKVLTITLLLSLIMPLHAKEYDICEDVVIDDVTENAFGQHGILYTGEIICYRDIEKTILKTKRTYDNGKPIGRHICYDDQGVENYSVSYDHTKIKKHGYNTYSTCKKYGNTYGIVHCKSDMTNPTWSDRPCKENSEKCIFRCK